MVLLVCINYTKGIYYDIPMHASNVLWSYSFALPLFHPSHLFPTRPPTFLPSDYVPFNPMSHFPVLHLPEEKTQTGFAIILDLLYIPWWCPVPSKLQLQKFLWFHLLWNLFLLFLWLRKLHCIFMSCSHYVATTCWWSPRKIPLFLNRHAWVW